RRQLEVRAVLEGAPVPAPLNRHALDLRGLLHDSSELVIQRPVPAHLVADHGGQINGMPGDVATLHGLRRAGGKQCSLALLSPQTPSDDEGMPGDLSSPMDDALQVRMYALEAINRALVELHVGLCPFSGAGLLPVHRRSSTSMQ